jgi:hypothetical protein
MLHIAPFKLMAQQSICGGGRQRGQGLQINNNLKLVAESDAPPFWYMEVRAQYAALLGLIWAQPLIMWLRASSGVSIQSLEPFPRKAPFFFQSVSRRLGAASRRSFSSSSQPHTITRVFFRQ